jgi:TRAP-type C4-dicarboxylate transport system permease small subunit
MIEGDGEGRGWLNVLDRAVQRATRWADEAAALVCAVLIVATTAAVVVYQRGITIVWLDDVLRMLLIWLVYLGSVSLCFHNDHITMDAVYLRLPPAVRRALNIAIAVLGIALCGYVSKIGFDSMAREIDYETLLPSGYLPAWPQTLAIPLCFALMTVAYLSFLYSVVTDRRQRSPGEAPDVPEGR